MKHIPLDFSNEDLNNFFSRYGTISSSLVCRDEKGICKGYAFVCFETPVSAANAIKELKEKSIAFPGLPPLYATYYVKKEERKIQEKIISNSNDAKFIASYISDSQIVIFFNFRKI